MCVPLEPVSTVQSNCLLRLLLGPHYVVAASYCTGPQEGCPLFKDCVLCQDPIEHPASANKKHCHGGVQNVSLIGQHWAALKQQHTQYCQLSARIRSQLIVARAASRDGVRVFEGRWGPVLARCHLLPPAGGEAQSYAGARRSEEAHEADQDRTSRSTIST